jgi:hypothetical protein
MNPRVRSAKPWSAALAAALVAFLSPAAMPQAPGGGASITLKSGPHKGRYAFAPTEACVLAAFTDKPPGVSVVMQSKDSSLSIDVPNLDEKRASEIQIVLVVAEVKQGAAGASTSSVTYEIDTRPDAVLRPVQKAERANKGVTGKATTTLMTQGNTVLLSFTGETMSGVKLEGELTCRKM